MAPRICTNLGQETSSFVGRQEDLAALGDLFKNAALVTVVGAPGVGKTRLARRFATKQVEASTRGHEGGVWFVDLTESVGSDDICRAVAGALHLHLGGAGQGAVDRLGAALADHPRLLVVLDNFEQLLPCAEATLGAWLRAAPRVRWLVTSREPLRLAEEQVHPLSPLSLPNGEAVRSDAVSLFLERAGAARPGYAPGKSDEEAVRKLVRLLDGIPLAIELAAARMGVLGVRQILADLALRSEVLASPGAARAGGARHATLWGAIGWSWQRLDPWEREALACVSVFRGGFSLDAARAVLDLTPHPDAPPVLDALHLLCRKSLLTTTEVTELDGELRFSMYLLVRDFAAEQLSPEQASGALRRHARYYAERGRAWAEGAEGAGWQRATAELQVEAENLLAVFHRCLGAPPLMLDGTALAVEAALALDELWFFTGPFAQRESVLSVSRGALNGAVADDALRGRVHWAAARLLSRRGDSAAAVAEFEQARALGERLGDSRLQGRALYLQAGTILTRDSIPEAVALTERAVALLRAAGDGSHEARALGQIGCVYADQGGLEAAAAFHEQALSLQRALGDRWEGNTLAQLARVQHELGRWGEARRRYVRAVELLAEADNQRFLGFALVDLGLLDQDEGRLRDARSRYREGLCLVRAVGDPYVEAIALHQLGSWYEEQDLPAEARLRYTEAVDRLRGGRVGYARQALAFAQLAALSAGEGNFAAARAELHEATIHAADLGAAWVARAIALHAARVDVARAREAAARGALEEAEALVATARSRRDEALSRRDPISLTPRGPLGMGFALRSLGRALDAWPRAGAGEERTALDGGALVVCPADGWVAPPRRAVVKLTRRRALFLVLLRLVEERRARPGHPVDLDELIRSGWPGQKPQREAGIARAYMAISALRKLGLGEVIARMEGGYLLDPGVPVRMVEGVAVASGGLKS